MNRCVIQWDALGRPTVETADRIGRYDLHLSYADDSDDEPVSVELIERGVESHGVFHDRDEAMAWLNGGMWVGELVRQRAAGART